ncbi:glutathione peroxidase [Luteimonas pelagia]
MPPTRYPRPRRARAFVRHAALAAVLLLSAPATWAGDSLLDHRYRPLAGKDPVHLATTYGGDVLLVVNTASKCGFTPQFEGLEALHARYASRGFAVLGFPSGDFKAQEFEDEAAIREFCTLTYGVRFPMFEKVHVVGAGATPLYRALERATGEAPAWNFHKYLVARDGRVLRSFGSRVAPDDPALVAAIESALDAPRPGGD